jgi:N6-adenosine-specific RNA methylase IME4
MGLVAAPLSMMQEVVCLIYNWKRKKLLCLYKEYLKCLSYNWLA